MKKISKNAMIGYPAGIITGITYGLNPLFGIPLMNEGASVEYTCSSDTDLQCCCSGLSCC